MIQGINGILYKAMCFNRLWKYWKTLKLSKPQDDKNKLHSLWWGYLCWRPERFNDSSCNWSMCVPLYIYVCVCVYVCMYVCENECFCVQAYFGAMHYLTQCLLPISGVFIQYLARKNIYKKNPQIIITCICII